MTYGAEALEGSNVADESFLAGLPVRYLDTLVSPLSRKRAVIPIVR